MNNRDITLAFTFLLLAIAGFWLGFVIHLLHLKNEIPKAQPLLMVQIFDVGDGDAAYLNAPGGLSVLADSGPDEAAAAHIMSEEHRLSRYPPKAIIITNCNPDSIGGLSYLITQWHFKGPVVLPCSVAEFVFTGGSQAQDAVDAASENHAKLYSMAQAQAIPSVISNLSSQTQASRTQITLIPITPPSPATADSEALRIDYNEGSMLYTAGLTSADEDMLISQHVNLNCDVLAAASSDNESSLSSEFLALTQPSVVTLSNSQESPPSEDVLGRLRSSDVKVGRTDVSGTIILGVSPDPAVAPQFFAPNAILPGQA